MWALSVLRVNSFRKAFKVLRNQRDAKEMQICVLQYCYYKGKLLEKDCSPRLFKTDLNGKIFLDSSKSSIYV